MQRILQSIIDVLSPIPCVRAIVLGGSRATGMQDTASDIDIGIYYDKMLDLPALNAAAKTLDDTHRDGLIGPPGSWGNWVNCGGWLTISGIHVDLILRDLARVEACIAQTDQGEISMHYQTGHPHMYSNVMYRGELAVSRTLYAADDGFAALKAHARQYPNALRHALTGFFLFEAGFSRDLAQKAYDNHDLYCLTGHLFRAVSALNQALYALNRTYCLNEKKAVARIENLTLAPQKYKSRVESIFTYPSSAAALDVLSQLIRDIQSLVQSAPY